MADKSAETEFQIPIAPPEPEKDRELDEKTRPVVRSGSGSDDDDDREKTKLSKQRWWGNPLKRNPPPVPEERKISPEWDTNIFSQAIFWWANGLLAVGYKRPLELNDLFRLSPRRHNKGISERLEGEFKRRVAKGSKHPLLFALNRTFFNEFWFGGLCQLIAIVLMTLAPLMIKYIILYASDAYYGDTTNSGRGVGLVIGVCAMQMVGAITINQWSYRSLIVGGMARGSLISMIYAKSQVISARAKSGHVAKEEVSEEVTSDEKSSSQKENKSSKQSDEGWSNGRVSNLMSTDTSRINQAVEWSQLLVTTPIQLVIALVQLIINLGYSALPGFGLLAIMGPGLYYVTRSLAKRRVKTNKITDARIGLTQELLSSIRFVKYFAWEKYFLDKLEAYRKKEIGQVQILLGTRSAITAAAMTLPVWAAILSFLTYSLTHDELHPAAVFSSLALFNTLRLPLNLLPMVIGQCIDAYVSLGRIESYLLAEDDTAKREVDESLPKALVFENASFTWETVGRGEEDEEKPKDGSDLSSKEINEKADLPEQQEPFHFDQLNLAIARDELVAVVGSVGCGKTSFLAAIAGEMRLTGGRCLQGSNIAYCSQYAWIQNATVRDNITFGKPYDKAWYNKVVDSCALRPDFKVFTNGDQTEVGERGITLSGGQKQRISIARAIYFNASIIVMDDPLSAVDASVGKTIMDEAICGVLQGKSRILATHQLHVLDRCDRIIYMQDGKIDAIGTYDELRSTNRGFMEMLASSSGHSKNKEEEEEEEQAIEALKPKLSRVNTKASVHETAVTDALMQTEERQQNSIKWTVYKEYFKASGTIWNVPLLVVLVCLAQSSQIMGTLWLSWWANGNYRLPVGGYIGVYAALGFSQSVFLCSYSILLTVKGTDASKVLLHNAMQRVLRAPMWFFDTTPLGRIINRFSADVNTMDNFLTEAIRMYALTFVTILSIFILIVVYYPYYIAAVVPALAIIWFMSSYFRTTNRELKRHEAVLRSAVFAVFGEAVAGTSVIKAYGVQDVYRERLDKNIDEMNSAYFLTFSSQCWLSLRLDTIGITLALITCLLIVTDAIRITPALAGVLLTYVLQVIGQIQFAVRQLAEVENAMNSTERIQYYANELPSEIPTVSQNLIEPPSVWPEVGNITFDDVQMRYRPGLPLVLKGLSVEIKGGERVGIVGRTGAGKSSIMSCLFRLVEIDGGCIAVDGVDISKLSLHDLRSRLSIIPQDPTLFKGTIRSNLDPMNLYSDIDLWNSLRQANLVDAEPPTIPTLSPDADITTPATPTNNNSPRIGLDDPVVAEGLNFSLGQRQLLAFARARLRNSRIIVCDEATSSVDIETDNKIQATMQTAFKGSTLLCIAHRLRTIINYDRVLVMDKGQIAECDVPYKLWRRQGSAFREICDKSAIRDEDFHFRG